MNQTNTTNQNFHVHHFVTFDGLRLAYRHYHPLTPPLAKKIKPHTLLCLSGLSRNSHDFHNFASLMQKKGHRILSLDYRGRGLSDYDPHPQNYHIGTYLEDVRHLLITINTHRVLLVGSSLGGLIAMAMGASSPRSLVGAVLNDIGPEFDNEWTKDVAEKLEKNHSFATWDDAVAHVKRVTPWLHNLSENEWLKRTQFTFAKDKHARITRQWDLHVLDLIKKRKKTQPLWHLLDSLAPHPLLLVRGETSSLLPASLFENMIDRLSSLKKIYHNPILHHVTVPERGHVPDLDETSFVKAFDTFTHSLDTTP